MAAEIRYRPSGVVVADYHDPVVEIPADAVGLTCTYRDHWFYVGWLEPIEDGE